MKQIAFIGLGKIGSAINQADKDWSGIYEIIREEAGLI